VTLETNVGACELARALAITARRRWDPAQVCDHERVLWLSAAADPLYASKVIAI
jgi:hypothetical protein